MSIVERLRQVDAYPKTLEDFRVKTYGGAFVTILSSAVMIMLFLLETRDFLTPGLSEELFVDISRGSKLRINLDIVVPRISCDHLSLDAMDTTGEQHLQILHNVYKRRLNLEGQPIEDPQKTDVVKTPKVIDITEKEAGNSTDEKCGDCYGAADESEGGIKCCNTCAEVQEAYKQKRWDHSDLTKFKQCENDATVERKKNAFSEGCQIYGYMEVNRVGGSFHIAPGESFSINNLHVHDVQPYSSSSFNMTHRIRHLSFGLKIPNLSDPIDDSLVVADKGAMAYHHYIKIVPTTFINLNGSQLQTNQFSVTRHSRQVSLFSGDSGMPGIFFNYELSPLMVKFTQTPKPFQHFLVKICTIIGGVFTVAGIIDSFLYHSLKAIQKKIELGKFS